MRKFIYIFLFTMLLCVLSIISVFFYLRSWSEQSIELPKESVIFRVPSGSSLSAIVNNLEKNRVNIGSWKFILLAKLNDKVDSIQAGTYEIKTGVTPIKLLNKLVKGDVAFIEFRIPEGFTISQLRALINKSSQMQKDSSALTDAEIIANIANIDNTQTATSLEGLLLPDTYRIDKGASDIQLYKRAYNLMLQKFNEHWSSRQANLPYSNPYQAMIMASIIEKETGLDRDRPMVAAVFVNRLKIGMRLQTDPTVIYGLGNKFDGNLRKVDLQTDTPYNSYTRNGLPPTPICMFSLASLKAALNPAESSALYFVARGDGTSQFSNTLQEHNAAVRQYQLNISKTKNTDN